VTFLLGFLHFLSDPQKIVTLNLACPSTDLQFMMEDERWELMDRIRDCSHCVKILAFLSGLDGLGGCLPLFGTRRAY
jgi:hypothetical protein